MNSTVRQSRGEEHPSRGNCKCKGFVVLRTQWDLIRTVDGVTTGRQRPSGIYRNSRWGGNRWTHKD